MGHSDGCSEIGPIIEQEYKEEFERSDAQMGKAMEEEERRGKDSIQLTSPTGLCMV